MDKPACQNPAHPVRKRPKQLSIFKPDNAEKNYFFSEIYGIMPPVRG